MIVFAGMLGFCCACTSEKNDKVSPEPVAPAMAATAAEPERGPVPAKVRNDGNSGEARRDQAYIHPVRPRVTDQLQAVVQALIVAPVYRWAINGVQVDGETGVLLPAGSFRKGDTVSVEVTAGKETYAAETVIVNTPPEVVKSALVERAIIGGGAVEIVAEAYDVDADPVTLTYQWSINDEPVEDVTENILPGRLVRKGAKLDVTIIPSDGEENGPIFVLDSLQVAGSPPHFTSSPVAGFEGNLYRYVAQAVDPDGDSLTYQLDVAPVGMTIETKTGQIRWQLGGQEQGEFPVRIVVADPDGLKAIQEYLLTIVLKY